ncbi:MAG: hypothetical protein JWR19_440 [Pedosphaera sp.]|nr:hypothetical protein [Pedosphaera sp.]
MKFAIMVVMAIGVMMLSEQRGGAEVVAGVMQAQYDMYAPDAAQGYGYYPNPDSGFGYLPQGGWPYSDSNICRTVRRQLVLDTFLVDAVQIKVGVQDAVVTLTGCVKTWDNRSRAENDAYGCGARSVVNLLQVRPW